MAATDVWGAIDAERKETVAMLESLDPAQWDAPTLCDQWRVRDVVGHLILGSTMSPGQGFVVLAKNGFMFNRAMARASIDKGRAEPAQLVKELAATVGLRKSPPMTRPDDLLSDTIIHSQDIRRPLGIQHAFPDEHLRVCLEQMKGMGYPMGAKKRAAGLRLEATDFDWSSGEGPVVRGPGEAILMALAGRKAAVADLEGDGAATFAARF